MDYGNYSIAYIFRLNKNGNLYCEWEWKETGLEMKELARSYHKFLHLRNLKHIVTIGDTDMFNKPAQVYNSGDHAPVKEFTDLGLKFERVVKKAGKTAINIPEEKEGFRVYCNRAVKSLLDWKIADNGMFLRRPKIYIVKGRCPNFWKTVPYLRYDPLNDNDVDLKSGTHHPYDAFKTGCISMKKLPDYKAQESARERMKRRLQQVKNSTRV